MTTLKQAVYLYCLARADQLNAVSGCGIDQQKALMIAPFKEVVAIYSAVELADFTGPEAEANLQDIGWIGPRALAHENVVAQAANSSPVLPARFGTIFSSFDKLQQLLTTKHDLIVDALDQINNRQEWSLKGYLDKKQAVKKRVAVEAAAKREEFDKLTPGARYFQEKKLETAARQSVSVWLNEQIVGIEKELQPFVVEWAGRQPLSREATGKESDMVLNRALLVEIERASKLALVVAEINKRWASSGVVLELSGPWPPYSFCPTFSLAAD